MFDKATFIRIVGGNGDKYRRQLSNNDGTPLLSEDLTARVVFKLPKDLTDIIVKYGLRIGAIGFSKQS